MLKYLSWLALILGLAAGVFIAWPRPASERYGSPPNPGALSSPSTFEKATPRP